MADQVAQEPLGPFERTLIDIFCKGSPCAAARAISADLPADFKVGAHRTGCDERLYAACQHVAACNHFCPLRQARAAAGPKDLAA